MEKIQANIERIRKKRKCEMVGQTTQRKEQGFLMAKGTLSRLAQAPQRVSVNERLPPGYSRYCGITFLVLLTLSALLPSPALAWELLGKVVGVADGDTVTLLTQDRRQARIRLAAIDTPEKRQPYGKRARQAISKLVFLREVRAKVVTKDRYGRLVAHIYVGDLWVNREMVCNGHAWVYRRYAHSRALSECEQRARKGRLGLWALPEAQRMPPWEWRHRNRSGVGDNPKANKRM